MAAPCGGATKPTRSANCVQPAMETGKVGMTRDATTINGEIETCRTRHDGTTEKLKEVTEMKTETETQEFKEISETRVMEQVEGNEMNDTKDEHTHR